MEFRNPRDRRFLAVASEYLAARTLPDAVPGRRRPRKNEWTRTGLHLEHLEDRSLFSVVPLTNVGPYIPPQHHLFNASGYLTGPSTASPIVIAENYLRSHAGELGFLSADLNNYLVTTDYVTQSTGATTLTFEQTFHGLEVFNADFHMTVAADGRLLNAGGGFVSGLSQRAGEPGPAPQTTTVHAVSTTVNTLGLPVTLAPRVVSVGENGITTLQDADVSLDDIAARLRYVAAPNNTVSLAWNLVVRTPDNAHWYNVHVDAQSGSFISLVDYSDWADYEVFAIPGRDPNDGPRTVQTNPDIFTPVPSPVPSPFGWHDMNGVAGPEFTITQGNNANAYADRNADNLPDAGSQPDGGAALNFTGALVPLDLTQAPSSYTAASVVNLFYLTNFLHDVHYLYGFDEAAGNFQVNNYGRGGVGNDAVQAEAQDGSGTNNANFATPPDGTAPRMQMFEFTLTNPRRDGDLDAEIVLHEYGHGVSNRLTGNGNGLSALQSGGMGEGWSDWWSLMLTQKTASETTAGRGVGTYVLNEPSTGLGIRDFRYDFDITNQSLETFLNYGLGSGQSVEVHDAGTRWAAVLWDINKLFIDKFGFEPNVYDSNSSAGNIRALHLIMTALKIQPLDPSFLDARNAILLADTLLYGGDDTFELWTAFARRGLGQFASTSDSNSTSLITSFVIPPDANSLLTLGSDVSKLEGNSGFTDLVFSVSFFGTLRNRDITVAYATAPLSATSGVDYIPTSGTLTFRIGNSAVQLITVQVIGDTAIESDETFAVRLTNPVNASLGRSEAIGTILNDDVSAGINDVTVTEGDAGTTNAVFTVSLEGTSHATASLSYVTSDGTANGGTDFVPRGGTLSIPPLTSSVTITVPIVGDKLNEGVENFFVTLSNSTFITTISKPIGIGTIIDNDPLPSLYVNDVQVTTTSLGVLAAVFTVALDNPSGRYVTVQYETTDGTAHSPASYTALSGTLSFAPGERTQFVTVPIAANAVYAPNEKFSLDLFNVDSAKIADGHGVATLVVAPPTPTDLILDDGDAGFSTTAGWTTTTNLVAYQLDYDYRAAGNGSGAATWTFNNLLPGSYQVFAHWIPFANWASNAPYTILDNQTTRGAVTVNQRLAPVGDLSNGITWQSLGTFAQTSGRLVVRLNDSANGFVIADAIRIVAGGIGQQFAEMDVDSSGQSIATGDIAPTFEDGTAFGSLPAASNSATHSFTITNTGNAELHLTGAPRVSVSGANPDDFTVITQPAFSVAPAGTTSFQVMFHPTALGLRQATISIDNDDPSEAPYTFAIEGTGLESGASQLILDESSAGAQLSGPWTTSANSSAYTGQSHSAPAGQGDAVATWSFNALGPGKYDVYTEWVPFGNRATNAPYTITNGIGVSTVVNVNQQQAPVGLSVNSTTWRWLASVDVPAGGLVVSLSNNANGFVIADAVMIVRQGTALPVGVPLTVPHNPAQPLDVNGDDLISGLDALLVINSLNATGTTANASPSASPQAADFSATSAATTSSATTDYFLDVNGDGIVSPRDALMVINYLIGQDSPSASPSVSAAPAASALTATPEASPSSAATDALQAVAVDQAIVEVTAPTDVVPAASLATSSNLSNPAPAASPSSSTTAALTPLGVRMFFASSAKKSADASPSGGFFDPL